MPHLRKRICTVFLTACVVWGIGSARADEILIGDRTVHRVRIVGYDRGVVEYRTLDGDYDRVDVAEIDYLVIDSVSGSADFNAAEEYLLKDRPAQAVDRYERALRTSRGMWAKLTRVRLLVAADCAGMSEKAIRTALAVIASDPVTGARLLPASLPAMNKRAARRTLKRIEDALKETNGPARWIAELLHYRLLRELHDVEADRLAVVVAAQSLPEGLLTPRTAAIKTDALGVLLRADRFKDVIDAVDAALPDTPAPFTADWLLLKAEAQYAIASDEGGYFDAALTAMRVAIHYSKSSAAGRALLLAAQVHEDTGRSGDAVRLLRECLARDGADESTKDRARAALARLSTGGANAS